MLFLGNMAGDGPGGGEGEWGVRSILLSLVVTASPPLRLDFSATRIILHQKKTFFSHLQVSSRERRPRPPGGCGQRFRVGILGEGVF